MYDYDAYRRSRHIGGVDGLRALAIAVVIAHHAGVGGIVARGILGVTTFFAISGFLVTTILLRERESTGTISLRNFHLRRGLRIWPLYYAVLAIYVVLVVVLERGTGPGARFFENLPHFLTFTANWAVQRADGGRIIFIFAWSLATQEQFYLLWPSVLRFGKRTVAPVAVLVLLLTCEHVACRAAATGLLGPDHVLVRIFTRSVWSPICLGALLAFAMHARRGFDLLRRVAGQPWSAPAAALLVYASVRFVAVPLVLFQLAVAYLICACVMGGSAPFRRVLGWPALVHVGKVSYGIYLLHMLAVNVVRAILPPGAPIAVFAAALPLSVAAATVSYDLFEVRFHALKARFLSGGAGTRPERLAIEACPTVHHAP